MPLVVRLPLLQNLLQEKNIVRIASSGSGCSGEADSPLAAALRAVVRELVDDVKAKDVFRPVRSLPRSCTEEIVQHASFCQKAASCSVNRESALSAIKRYSLVSRLVGHLAISRFLRRSFIGGFVDDLQVPDGRRSPPADRLRTPGQRQDVSAGAGRPELSAAQRLAPGGQRQRRRRPAGLDGRRRPLRRPHASLAFPAGHRSQRHRPVLAAAQRPPTLRTSRENQTDLLLKCPPNCR